MIQSETEPKNNRQPFKKVNWPYKWVAGILGGIAFWAYILIWIFAPRWGDDPDDYEIRTA
jgi:hypothetical protein